MIKTKVKRAKATRHKLGKTLPRLSVFRSNQAIYAQAIDDQKGQTIVYASATFAGKEKARAEKAREVGMQIAQKLIAKKVKKVVFDRGAYKYHGLIRSLADGAREGGLEF
ncbi:50S ribosomal protein L18 [Candidatus Microgenomates bacterium]|nr:50S ribosomal protein L18 [Candidatus Microgenomates bacterium]